MANSLRVTVAFLASHQLGKGDSCSFFLDHSPNPQLSCSQPAEALLFIIRAWTYILLCSDGSYYTGSTTNLDQRIADHNNGRYGGYTSSRLPVVLAWSQEFSDVRDAIALERQIKGWTRKKKEALIRGDFQLLHELARSTGAKRRASHSS